MKATGKPGTIDGIRKGVRRRTQTGISTATLKSLAPILKTSVGWLASGSGDPDLTDEVDTSSHETINGLPTVPLLGYVRAGASAVYLPLHDSELDRVPAPPGSNDRTRALEVRGDSLGALFDRWIVFFDDEQRPISPDLINRLCVVALIDGRVLVKKIVQRNGSGGYDLLSNTEEPIKNALIKWAARVKHMAPR